jgi:hypothetical protein
MMCGKDDSGTCCGMCDYNPVAVIATHQRVEITEQNIKSLLNQGIKVVLIVSLQNELENLQKMPITVKLVPNNPLGRKWQKGVEIARKLGANPLLIVGSDDILSKDYLKKVLMKISLGFDVIGCTSWFTFAQGKIYQCEYTNKNQNFPIGSGKAFSKRILDKIKWNLFNTGINKRLDDQSYIITKNNGAKIHLIREPEVLAVKGNWTTMNSMEAYLKSPNISCKEVSKDELKRFDYVL